MIFWEENVTLPVGQWCQRKFKAGDAFSLLCWDRKLNFTAVFSTLVGCEEENVPAKLEIVPPASTTRRSNKLHLFNEDWESIMMGWKNKFKVAAQHTLLSLPPLFCSYIWRIKRKNIDVRSNSAPHFIAFCWTQLLQPGTGGKGIYIIFVTRI